MVWLKTRVYAGVTEHVKRHTLGLLLLWTAIADRACWPIVYALRESRCTGILSFFSLIHQLSLACVNNHVTAGTIACTVYRQDAQLVVLQCVWV